MPRFQLDPSKSAMENLFDCASMATLVIMRAHSFYHLHGEYREELFELIRDETCRHFIEHKVRRHTYAYASKEGKPLNFADNVISSCFSVSGNLVDPYMKRLTRLNSTADIEPMKFRLGHGDRLPNYVSETEAVMRYKKAYRPYARLKRPCDRARRLLEAYEDYTAEAGELGLCEVLSFDRWLGRNGYTAEDDPELFWHLLPYDEKLELHRLNRDIEYAKLPQDQRHRRDYQREYARKRRERERAEIDRKLREVLGDPPKGYQWFKCKNGRVGQRRLRK